jgi:multiple sugar transport system permease protein
MRQLTLKDRLKLNIKKDGIAYLIMIPSLLLFGFFVWQPLLSNIFLSFFTTTGFTRDEFVWFQNYQDVLSDPIFAQAFINTIKYTFWSVIIGFILPIILAILLNEVVHFRSFFRTIIYFPNMVPGLAAVLMWFFLFEPEQYGVFNVMLDLIGLESSTWLNDPNLVIPLIVITMTWKGAGATTLIYLAILQSLDNTYYEASRLEGATLFQRIRYITLPHLIPTIRMLFILQVISVFQVFYEPLVMTDGGPNNASLSLLQLIYKYAYRSGNVAQAAALGVIVAVMLFLLTTIYLKISSQKEGQS